MCSTYLLVIVVGWFPELVCSPMMDEDCLYLNVYNPPRSSSNKSASLPVMVRHLLFGHSDNNDESFLSSLISPRLKVFFHGGDFIMGTAGYTIISELGWSQFIPIYYRCVLHEGVNLALKGQVVVVTVNYRLGVLGFLADQTNFEGKKRLLCQF